MPYIDPERRTQLYPEGIGCSAMTSGDLNYIITTICLEYLPTTPRYTDYNEVIGALECCKLEMYRRAVAPYEDVKIQQHGDVYV
jgi:hypothetical protein